MTVVPLANLFLGKSRDPKTWSAQDDGAIGLSRTAHSGEEGRSGGLADCRASRNEPARGSHESTRRSLDGVAALLRCKFAKMEPARVRGFPGQHVPARGSRLGTTKTGRLDKHGIRVAGPCHTHQATPNADIVNGKKAALVINTVAAGARARGLARWRAYVH